MRCCNVLVIPSVRLLQLQLHIDFANTYHPPSNDFLKYACHKTNQTSHIMSTIHQAGQPHQISFKYAHFIYFQPLQTEGVILTPAHILPRITGAQ